MQWDREDELRHSGFVVWPGLAGGRKAEVLRILEQVRLLGYDGRVESSSADSILEGWIKAGWIEVSPDRTEIRLTADGEEQLAQWQEEDRLWRSGDRQELEMPKRLKAGQPATNLRRICQVIGKRTVDCIHDPYTRVLSVQNLLNLSDLGASLSPQLRLLGATLSQLDAQTLAGFVQKINIEKSSHWEARTYTSTQKPHRRFLICADGSIVTCGMSLNHVDKDEVLDVIPAADKRAEHDRKFFEEKWKLGTVVQ